MIDTKGSAHWSGGLKDGKGTLSTETGVLKDQVYSFGTRFEGEAGTNPEELLGAAHAACFSMALSNILGDYDLKADSIETTATVSMDPDSLSIAKVHLDVRATIPDASAETFGEAAMKAKENCPVSKLFDTEITMDATLG